MFLTTPNDATSSSTISSSSLITDHRSSRTPFHRDHVILAVLLAQVELRGEEEIANEYEFLLESGEGAVAAPGWKVITGGRAAEASELGGRKFDPLTISRQP